MRTPLKPGTIGRARNLRTHTTDAERKLWYKLRELKALGYHFRRQVPFRSYILDFVEHSAKLVIELDGGQHGEDAHRSRDAIARGKKRGDSAATYVKLKYDRQIIAIARVAGATTIYSDDGDIRALAKETKIKVIGIADLPLPPEDAQQPLPLSGTDPSSVRS
jgi:hypothetical protein